MDRFSTDGGRKSCILLKAMLRSGALIELY